MSFIPTPGAVRVDIQFVMAGQQVHNIIWCKRETPWTDVQRLALAEAIETWWSTSGKLHRTAAIALTQITVVNQDSQEAPSTVHVVSPVIPGTSAGDSFPNGTALCATLRTAFRGRNYRGRMYLAGFGELNRADTISVIVDLISALLTELAALKTAIEALGAVWVIVSKFVNKTPRASGLATAISAISMDQYLDSQRRRLGLRGV